jgi:hypothetical protein
MMCCEMFYTKARMIWTGFGAESATANILHRYKIKDLGQKRCSSKKSEMWLFPIHYESTINI